MHESTFFYSNAFNVFFARVALANSNSSSIDLLSKVELSSRKRRRQEFSEREHSSSETSYRHDSQLEDTRKTSFVDQLESNQASDFEPVGTGGITKRRKGENKCS